eukprot:jgi/Tetstr1/463960/TSEL_008765.t1
MALCLPPNKRGAWDLDLPRNKRARPEPEPEPEPEREMDFYAVLHGYTPREDEDEEEDDWQAEFNLRLAAVALPDFVGLHASGVLAYVSSGSVVKDEEEDPRTLPVTLMGEGARGLRFGRAGALHAVPVCGSSGIMKKVDLPVACLLMDGEVMNLVSRYRFCAHCWKGR